MIVYVEVVLADVDPSWLLLSGIALLTMALLRFTYRGRGRGRRAAPPPRPSATASPTAGQQELIRQLEAKEVELHELARETAARLDNKIAILQRLLSESESAAARLERLLAAAEQTAVRRGDD